MAVFFNKIKRWNPLNKQTPEKWHPSIKSIGKVTEKEIVEQMADEITLNPKEAELALYQFQKVMIRNLLEGKTIQLAELGTFYLKAHTEGVENREKVTAKLIKHLKVRFMPSEYLHSMLSKAEFKPLDFFESK